MPNTNPAPANWFSSLKALTEMGNLVAEFVDELDMPNDTTTMINVATMPGLPVEAAVDQVLRNQLGMLGLWSRFNRPTFQLTEDLTAGLLLSDPRNMSASELRFPYPMMRLVLPQSFLSLMQLSGRDGVELHQVEQVFVGMVPDPIVDVYQTDEERGVTLTRDAVNRVAGHPTDIHRLYVMALGGGYTLAQTYIMYPDADIGDVFDTQQGWMGSTLYELSEVDQLLISRIVGIAVNLSFYINEHPREVQEATQAAKRTRGITGKKKVATPRLGRTIKLGGDMIKAAQSFATGEKQTRKSRWVVRGFFNTFWTGKGRKTKTVKWIKPQWRGRGDMGQSPKYEVNPDPTTYRFGASDGSIWLIAKSLVKRGETKSWYEGSLLRGGDVVGDEWIGRANMAAVNNRMLERDIEGFVDQLAATGGGYLANPAGFDELGVGGQIEMEHTDDPAFARRIAMDHLEEDPHYYETLCQWHKDDACPNPRRETPSEYIRCFVVEARSATNDLDAMASIDEGFEALRQYEDDLHPDEYRLIYEMLMAEARNYTGR